MNTDETRIREKEDHESRIHREERREKTKPRKCRLRLQTSQNEEDQPRMNTDKTRIREKEDHESRIHREERREKTKPRECRFENNLLSASCAFSAVKMLLIL